MKWFSFTTEEYYKIFLNEAAQFEHPHKIRSANYEKLTLQSTVHITIYITRRYETINKMLINNKKLCNRLNAT